VNEHIDRDLYDAPHYHPGADAPEIEYMLQRRRVLGGFLPERRNNLKPITLPDAGVNGARKVGQAV
jgi:pyruvate dehydrogenase E1 component